MTSSKSGLRQDRQSSGDVSGKGIPAALLVSVVQGAIRSSTASEHEYACERINCMLCERTACERFATLFWGVFDPVTRTLRYVNAGHPAPFLIRQVKAQVADEPAIPAGTKTQIIRLDEGGPVLGVLPDVRYSAGAIEFAGSDTLILYSDGLMKRRTGTEKSSEWIAWRNSSLAWRLQRRSNSVNV